MSSRTTSFASLQRWAAAGFACWLLLSPAAPAAAHAGRSHARSCEAPKKGKSAGARGRKADKKSSSASEASTSESSSSSQSDDSDDLSGLDDVAPAPKRAEPAPKPAPAKPAREEPAAEAEEESATEDSSASESEADAPSASEDADAEPAPEIAAGESESGPSVVIDAYAGFGIATRSVHMPVPMMMTGVLNLQPGVTPAAEVGLRVTSHPNAPFSFYVHLIYQSALGFSVTEHPPIAIAKEVNARSERVALEFAPRWHFANSKLDVAIPLGATVRTLWAEVHTSQTPSFSLVGPHVRVEAIYAFNDILSLRLSPELHLIMMVDEDLRTAGIASMGPAVGGDASVDARLSQTWSFGLNYRESHAFLPARRGDVSFRDVERYVTVRVIGSF